MAQLVQQIRPWASKAIIELEERMTEFYTAILDKNMSVLHGYVDAFERRLEDCLSKTQVLDLSTTRIKIH